MKYHRFTLTSAIAFILLVSVAVLSAGEDVTFVRTDEFNGPFPSWRDVKRDYGAKGDGLADDSDAINKALADLKNPERKFSVLYLPAGVYRVARTVTTSPCKTHHEGSGIAVVGEDPATTIIKWAGEDHETVFSYTAWYSKISRLTIDGSGGATAILSGVYCDAGRVIPIVSMQGDGNLFYDCGICAAGSSPDFPMFKFQDFSGRAFVTVSSLVECAGGDTGPRLTLEEDCSRGSVRVLGTCFQAKSHHEVKDLFTDNSSVKCGSAGAYLSSFESPVLPSETLRPDDVTLGGTAGARPGLTMMRALAFFAEGSQPRVAGISDNRRARIHSVNVKVNGETGVLIRGAK